MLLIYLHNKVYSDIGYGILLGDGSGTYYSPVNINIVSKRKIFQRYTKMVVVHEWLVHIDDNRAKACL